MSDCTQCDPCETKAPQVCEELPISSTPKKIVVENEYFCKETLKEPAQSASVLLYDGSNVKWATGAEDSPVALPKLTARLTTSAPRLATAKNTKTWEYWRPTISGNNFILFWNGTAFTIDTLLSLFPSGNGIYVKEQNSSSFKPGTTGQFLYIENGQINFKTFDPVTPPAGTILYFAGSVIPSGWLLCDGSAYGRTISDPSPQPTLFSIIGTTYGSGDGLTTFNIPDLRGVFVRGLDNNRNIDPFRTEGVLQSAGFKSHNHTGSTSPESNHTHTYAINTGNESNPHTHTVATNEFFETQPTISATRPRLVRANARPISDPVIWDEDYILTGSSTQATQGRTTDDSTQHTHSVSATTSSVTPHAHVIFNSGTTETRPVNVALNCIIKT